MFILVAFTQIEIHLKIYEREVKFYQDESRYLYDYDADIFYIFRTPVLSTFRLRNEKLAEYIHQFCIRAFYSCSSHYRH